MRDYERLHRLTLDELLGHLHIIDEDISKVEWVMREGSLYRTQGEQKPFCDLLLGYYDKEGCCVEVKRSKKRRNKGIEQLENGEYLMEKMGYSPIRKKILYYNNNDLYYELIR